MSQEPTDPANDPMTDLPPASDADLAAPAPTAAPPPAAPAPTDAPPPAAPPRELPPPPPPPVQYPPPQVMEKPPRMPQRPRQGHKGMFGRVLVVGGNDEMIGAPVLAATAALRMGAGLVHIAVPKHVLAAAITMCPELVGLGLAEDGSLKRLMDAAEAADAIVIGPGLGRSKEAKIRLKALVGLEKPLVVDADALNTLAALKQWPGKSFKAHAVLTPHPAEMRRLAALLPTDQAGAWAWSGKIPSDDNARKEIVLAAARNFEQVVALKGIRTLVTDGHRIYANFTGDSTLSKAGTGDVLSGMIGCLLAQHVESFEAACLAVHLHGMAGEMAGRKFGLRSALAREVIAHIPQAIVQHEQATQA